MTHKRKQLKIYFFFFMERDRLFLKARSQILDNIGEINFRIIISNMQLEQHLQSNQDLQCASRQRHHIRFPVEMLHLLDHLLCHTSCDLARFFTLIEGDEGNVGELCGILFAHFFESGRRSHVEAHTVV